MPGALTVTKLGRTMGKSTIIKKRLPYIVFAVFAGIWADLSAAIAPAAKDMEHCLNYEPDLFAGKNLAAAAVFAVIVYRFLLLIRDKAPDIKADAGGICSGKPEYLKVWGILMVCWGLWWFIFFPGAAMNDTISMMESPTGPTALMPPFYTAFIYWWMRIFTALLAGSSFAAFAVLVFVQMSLGASIVAYCYFWLWEKGVRPQYRKLFLVFYMLHPVVADYSIAVVKDVPYAFLTLLLVPLLADLAAGKRNINKTQRILLILSLAGIWACRSNGKYIVFLVCLMLALKVPDLRRLLAVFFIIMYLCNTAVVRYDRTRQPLDKSFAEAISVTYAQIGATVKSGGEIAAEDQEVLFQVLPEEDWYRNYSFSFVDPIKFSSNFNIDYLNEHKTEYLQAWMHTLIRNPEVYFKAYGYHTYGFWNLGIAVRNLVDSTQSVFSRINNNTDNDSLWGKYLNEIGLHNAEFFPANIGPVIKQVLRIAVFGSAGILGAGWLLLPMLICIFYVLLRKRYRLAMIFVPALGNWICMMLASPGSRIYRYNFYLLLSLPMFVMITLMELKN